MNLFSEMPDASLTVFSKKKKKDSCGRPWGRCVVWRAPDQQR